GGRGGSDARGRILDHEAFGPRNAHPRRHVQQQVRCGLAVRHLAGGNEARLEEPGEPGGREAGPDTVQRPRASDTLGRTQTRAPALVTQSDESLSNDTNRAVVAKVGQGASGRLLHSFLIPLGTTGDDTPESG